MTYKPPLAPNCWGSKYQDGEEECKQCRFSDTCRSAVLSRVVTPEPPRYSLPVVSSPPALPPGPQAIVPLPSSPYIPPAPPIQRTPSAPQATVPYYQSYSNAYSPPIPPIPTQQTNQPHYTFYSLPNTTNPNPASPMHRPGVQGQSYYFNQYPGESVTSRVVKNSILRGLVAIFEELVKFFMHWTWPPRAA
jgi:hypothetical protein